MDSSAMSTLTMLIPLLGVFVIMYFLIIRPQNKKEKQAAAMRNSIEVGDGVTTIGGIVGRVASIKEDTFGLADRFGPRQNAFQTLGDSGSGKAAVG